MKEMIVRFITRSLCCSKKANCDSQLVPSKIIYCVKETLNIPLTLVNKEEYML